MIGLAFEVHATHENKQTAIVAPDGGTVCLQNEYQNIEPSIVDMMLYSYCYIGLFTGVLLHSHLVNVSYIISPQQCVK